jgi:aspartate kinase
VEEPIITGVAGDLSQAKVVVVGIPDIVGKAAEIFTIIAEAGVNLDMIVQNVPAADTGLSDISFTVAKTDGQTAIDALNAAQSKIGFEKVMYDDEIGKLSIVGAGMRTNAGVSAQLFAALSKAGINIEMISTSEIRISVVIDDKDLNKAMEVVHTAFDLDSDVEAKVHGGTGR